MSTSSRWMQLVPVALALVAAAAAGCGAAGWPDILEVRYVSPPSGGPHITRVRDMGQPLLPRRGPYQGMSSDGVAIIGELLLIEGDNLGKQPTVHIGGRAAEVLRRTEGDGIVVRVPVATPSGATTVEVTTARGRSKTQIPIRRLGLVTLGARDQVHVLAVTREGAEPVGKPLAIPHAQLVRFSGDGSTAYVASAGGTTAPAMTVVDLTTAGGPTIVARRELPGRAVALATAEEAPLLAVVDDRSVTFFDLRDPLRPAHYPSFPLPGDIVRGRVVGADLDPEGGLLALLLAEGNRLAAFDVRRPGSPTLLTTIDVVPEARVPVVRDLHFSADGGTLWVVSGANATSMTSGPQLTRLTAVKLTHAGATGAPRVISVWRTLPVPGATAPVGLAVARGQMVASGATIRLAPENAALFVTGVQPALLKLASLDPARPADAAKAAALWRHAGDLGMLVRADANGGGGPLFSLPALLTSLDITPDAQIVVAVACKVATGKDGPRIEGGVVVTPLWGRKHTPTFVPLATFTSDLVRPPFRVGEVRIQP